MPTKLFFLSPNSLCYIAAIFGLCAAITSWLARNYQEKRMEQRGYGIHTIGRLGVTVVSGMIGYLCTLLAILYLLIVDGIAANSPHPNIALTVAVAIGVSASGFIPAVWFAPQLFGFSAEWEELLDHDKRIEADTIKKIREGKISLTQ